MVFGDILLLTIIFLFLMKKPLELNHSMTIKVSFGLL
jgi:hypothetical protein